MVGDMVADPSNSHGFMMRLATEVPDRNLSFYTSDFPNASKHPKLEITYTVGDTTTTSISATICQGESYDFNGLVLTETGTYQDTTTNNDDCGSSILDLVVLDLAHTELTETIFAGENYDFNGQSLTNSGIYQDTLSTSNGCDSIIVLDLTVMPIGSNQTLVLQPDSTLGKDAMVWEDNGRYGNTDKNYGQDDRLLMHAGTNNGIPDFTRSLIDFDLDQVPSGAVISSAKLTLYNNPTTHSFDGKHRNESSGYVQRVTSDWEERVVNWNNQPSYSAQNKVSYSSLTGNENLEDLDVTALVRDMLADPENSYGFMLRLQTEQRYRAAVFASSDHSNADLHPKLEITFTTNPNPNADDIEITSIEKNGATSNIIKWRSTRLAAHFELQVRIKDTLAWETAERLNTNATKAYFYGPLNKTFEARVIAYYENENIISNPVEFSTYLED